jgi:hypothetical protein
MGSTCCKDTQKTKTIRVNTLNYCGIPSSPFEFYISDYEPQLEIMGNIFEKMCNQELVGFKENSNLTKLFGSLEKNFKKGRYSPMYEKLAGVMEVEGDTANPYRPMTEAQFNATWEDRFKEDE